VTTHEALTPPRIAAVAEHLRAQPAWSELPIVILLDRASPSLRIKTELEHAWPRSRQIYYQRPITPVELVSGVQAALLSRLRQRDVRDYIDREVELRRELNHRVKNILAVTHSVAHLTSLAAGSLEEFREVFHGRLEALAAANELLTASGWHSTSLEALLRRALLPHGEPGESRLELSVEDVPIGGVLVQDLTLALHELATNATKHGALSVPRGRVAVEAGPAVAARERLLRLVWRELDGPAVRAPTRQGFGTRLLRQLIIRRHGGRLEMDWRADGLVCSLELPLNGRREATT